METIVKQNFCVKCGKSIGNGEQKVKPTWGLAWGLLWRMTLIQSLILLPIYVILAIVGVLS